MIKDVVDAIASAARKLLTNWGALLISLAFYAALIAALYFFFTTREATKLQLVLNLVIALAAVFFFFMLQAMGLSYVRIGVGPLYLLRRAVKDGLNLLLVSLPLILLAWLLVFLLGQAEQKFVADAENPRRWVEIAISWGRISLLCFILPLVAIHCWIAAEREGLAAAFKGFFRSIGRALTPRSVLIYALVIAVFGAIVYFLFFTKIRVNDEWTELLLFGARLVAALLFVFLGWLLTLGAMAEMTSRRAMKELEV